jgi:phosphate transport system substrate-binding protein
MNTMNKLSGIFLCISIVLFLTACGRPDIETIVIRGSDTEVNMVLQIAETYMENDPDISIAVTGGGSGTGIAALINERTDIANASRAFKDEELEIAAERGIDVRPIIFAVDALCFIVNEELPIDGLSLQQIRDIFTGKTSSWKDFGGKDVPISLYGRQGNSGTFVYIQQNILGADYSMDMKQMNGNSQIIEGIRNDIAGIGYVGIGNVVDKKGEVMPGTKVLSIQADGQETPVSPLLAENITNGSYKVVRPLYQYVDGKPENKLLDFILYELSEEGQEMILESGYFPISDETREQNIILLNHE